MCTAYTCRCRFSILGRSAGGDLTAWQNVPRLGRRVQSIRTIFLRSATGESRNDYCRCRVVSADSLPTDQLAFRSTGRSYIRHGVIFEKKKKKKTFRGSFPVRASFALQPYPSGRQRIRIPCFRIAIRISGHTVDPTPFRALQWAPRGRPAVNPPPRGYFFPDDKPAILVNYVHSVLNEHAIRIYVIIFTRK